MDNKTIERFSCLFRGFTGAHTKCRVGSRRSPTGKLESKVWVEFAPPEHKDFGRHLLGDKIGIGIIPLMDDNRTVLFGVIDTDDYRGGSEEVIRRVRDLDLPLVPVFSKSGGVHLYLFLIEPVEAELVQMRLRNWAAAMGLADCEFFPKQISRENKNDVGNAINLPYFGDTRKSENRSLEEFLDYAESQRVSLHETSELKVEFSEHDSAFFDGPPCLQHMERNGFEVGGRNNGLFAVGIYLKLKHPDDYEDHLHKFNYSLGNPLPAREVAGIVESLKKKEYFYNCKASPLCKYCEKTKCETQPFGISALKQPAPIEIDGIVKIESLEDRPVYCITVNEKRIQIEGAEDFLNQQKFRTLCFEKCNIIWHPVKSKSWTDMIEKAKEGMIIVEAPEDTDSWGEIKEAVMEYIRRHGKEDKDRLAMGNPWVDYKAGFSYVRWTYLKGWLKERLGTVKSKMVWGWFRQYWRVDREVVWVKGTTYSVWKIPYIPPEITSTIAEDPDELGPGTEF